MLLYIHGFNSSSASGKALELGAWLNQRGLGEAYVCPDLPHRPAAAMALSSVSVVGNALRLRKAETDKQTS